MHERVVEVVQSRGDITQEGKRTVVAAFPNGQRSSSSSSSALSFEVAYIEHTLRGEVEIGNKLQVVTRSTGARAPQIRTSLSSDTH